jgi:hypothetical protein
VPAHAAPRSGAQNNPSADLDVQNIGPDGFNHARTFMAEHGRKGIGPVSIGLTDIGVAHARCVQPDENLPRARIT